MNIEPRCVMFVAKNEARVESFDLPELQPDQVRLEAHFTLVSTGTELAYLTGKHHEIQSGKRSFPMGASGAYSMVGEIIEVGGDVTGWSVGQRVMAMAGHASVVNVTPDRLVRVPESIPSDQASFAIVGSIALHGVRMAGIGIGHSVLVTGLGLIGQLTVQLAKIAGASQVLVSDPSEARVNLAVKLGATAGHIAGSVPLKKRLEGDLSRIFSVGLHHAIETSGAAAALCETMECLNPEGRISLLGCSHDPITLDLYTHLQRKQLRLIGAYQPRCPETPTAEYPWSQKINRQLILDWIAAGRLDVASLLNNAASPENVREMYLNLIEQDAAVAGGIDWRKG